MDTNERRTALIIGVGSANGLGAAIARRFAKGGFNVAIAGRNREKISTARQSVQLESEGKVEVLVGDASKEADVARFLTEANASKRLDVVIYNAGQNRRESIFDVTPETFEMIWREHTFGGFLVGQAAARLFKPLGHGSILFTGASGSLRGKSHFAAFGAAKAGLRSVAQSLARELGPLGIHVGHIIIDGGIEGERLLSKFPDLAEKRGPDGLLKISAIAEAYWMLHHQQRSAWTLELDLRPWAEPF